MKKSELKKKNLTKNTIAQKRLSGKPSKAKTAMGFTLLLLGLAFIPTGFLLSNYVQYQLDEGIKDTVKVPHPHNSEFDEWVSNDYEDAIPKYKTFYMWNLTNADAFLGGAIPEYEELGPFVYRQFDTKYDISFSDDKDEVSYKEYNTYQLALLNNQTYEIETFDGKEMSQSIDLLNESIIYLPEYVGDDYSFIILPENSSEYQVIVRKQQLQ